MNTSLVWVTAGVTCILRLHLHSLLLLPAESISRRPFRHLDENREATDPEVRRGGHDCTIGLGLLAELKTTAVVCIHVEQAWQQPTCNQDLNLRFSALLTHQTWTLWLFLHACGTLVHILTPHLGSKCSALCNSNWCTWYKNSAKFYWMKIISLINDTISSVTGKYKKGNIFIFSKGAFQIFSK